MSDCEDLKLPAIKLGSSRSDDDDMKPPALSSQESDFSPLQFGDFKPSAISEPSVIDDNNLSDIDGDEKYVASNAVVGTFGHPM